MIKTAIWTITILGFIPAVLLASMSVSVMLHVRKSPDPAAPAGFLGYLVPIELFGLTSSVFPHSFAATAIFVGVALVCVGLYFHLHVP